MSEKELNQTEETMNPEVAVAQEVQEGQAPTEEQVQEAKAAMEQMLGIDTMNVELKAKQNIQNFVSQIYSVCMMDSLCKILTKAGITTKSEINVGAGETTISMLSEQRTAVLDEIAKITEGPESPMKSFEISFREAIIKAIDEKIGEIMVNNMRIANGEVQ